MLHWEISQATVLAPVCYATELFCLAMQSWKKPRERSIFIGKLVGQAEHTHGDRSTLNHVVPTDIAIRK
jgi:hypothetical protein